MKKIHKVSANEWLPESAEYKDAIEFRTLTALNQLIESHNSRIADEQKTDTEVIVEEQTNYKDAECTHVMERYWHYYSDMGSKPTEGHVPNYYCPKCGKRLR